MTQDIKGPFIVVLDSGKIVDQFKTLKSAQFYANHNDGEAISKEEHELLNENKEILVEAKLNEFVSTVTKEIMNFIKSTLSIWKRNSEKQIQRFLKQYTFPMKLAVEFVVARGTDIDDIMFSGESKEYGNYNSKLKLKLLINPNDEPTIYNELTGRIKGLLFHELEHKTQEGINRISDRPSLTDEEQRMYSRALDSGDFVSYFTNKLEVPAYIKQMYNVAKFYKKPVSVVIDYFLDGAVDAEYITKEEKEKITKVWSDEIKRLYPSAKFVSENKLSLSQLLLEVKLDGFVSDVSNELLQYVKKSKDHYATGQEKKYGALDKKTGYRTKEFKRYEAPLDFTLYVALNRKEKVSEAGFFVDATTDNSGDDDNVLVSIAIDPSQEPKVYSTMLGHIKDTLRHEFEHLTQDGINRIDDRETPSSNSLRSKITTSKKDQYKYFLLQDEIPAMVHGLYTRAKYEKKPLKNVFDDYLTEFIKHGTLTSEQKEHIIKVWMNYAKTKISSLK